MCKYVFISLILIISFSSHCQYEKQFEYDTLIYKSGMIRSCNINEIVYPTIYFTSFNSKGIQVESSVSITKLKMYLDYDSTGKILLNETNSLGANSNVPIINKPRTDSLWIAKHHLSVNPFSPFFFGLNTVYSYRFGTDLQLALIFPFRIFTFYGAGLMVNTGIGFNYIPYETEQSHLSVGFIPQFYFVDDIALVGFPVTLGYLRNLNERLTFNMYFGVGPKLGKELNFPLIIDGHIGIGFKLGEKYLTHTAVKKP